MLAPNGNPPFHPLPHETVLHTASKSISLSIESGKDLPAGDERKKTISCPSGTVYLTNLRVLPHFFKRTNLQIIFLPEKLSSTAEVQSFAVPIKRVSDSHVTQRNLSHMIKC